MGRRTRIRWVKETPNNFYFPNTEPSFEESIVLTISEFESMRLKHYLNFDQNAAADEMGISQPTFSRILENAHQKTTQALIKGKLIKIYGGNIDYKVSFIGYGCIDCNHEWEDNSASKDNKVNCVKCNSKNIYFFVREQI
ncbi:MAG: DUF134 domain-containing protein [Candidatus Lokiarchaeota archaeon]|nr:DUF134 domain-containing protein [Candidatus Lokiarchaeota archaeon]